MKLFEIVPAFRRLTAQIEEVKGVITAEVSAELERLGAIREDKIDAIGTLIAEAKATVKAREGEIKRLSLGNAVDSKRAQSLSKYLHDCLRSGDIQRLDGKLFRIRRQANSRPFVLFQGEAELLPEKFNRVRTTYSLDVDAILTAYEAGEELPEGVVVEPGEHIRIEVPGTGSRKFSRQNKRIAACIAKLTQPPTDGRIFLAARPSLLHLPCREWPTTIPFGCGPAL